MKRLLVLRPEPGATATAKRARQLGLEVVAAPLFEIEPVEWEMPTFTAFDGLLLTSANAVRHGGPGLGRLQGLPVFAVGEATARISREAGFNVAVSGDEGVDGLLASIDSKLKLLHLCGEDQMVPSCARQEIIRKSVYRARPTGTELRGVSDVVALIHSPRAGARFSELVKNVDRQRISIAAISTAALRSAGSHWAVAEAAGSPNDEALLALAVRLCNKTAAQ
jgi:uroporphyrinogen-III synthase